MSKWYRWMTSGVLAIGALAAGRAEARPDRPQIVERPPPAMAFIRQEVKMRIDSERGLDARSFRAERVERPDQGARAERPQVIDRGNPAMALIKLEHKIKLQGGREEEGAGVKSDAQLRQEGTRIGKDGEEAKGPVTPKSPEHKEKVCQMTGVCFPAYKSTDVEDKGK